MEIHRVPYVPNVGGYKRELVFKLTSFDPGGSLSFSSLDVTWD